MSTPNNDEQGHLPASSPETVAPAPPPMTGPDTTPFIAADPAAADAGATRYSAPSPPPDATDERTPREPVDAAATRYAAPPADPHATAYTPTSDVSDVSTGHLPRRFGGYELMEEMGRGGMGVVYKARQLALNRVVALKMILSGVHADEAELARFRAEAEAVARSQHPNIVQIYEIGEADGRHFLSLEFCPGGGLDRSLNGTPLPPAGAARLLEMLARAIHAAHQQQVIHRDLKPSNVLLAADGSPKITDFGLAKRLDDVGHTQTGAVMGTPSYMAPEQAAGKTKEIGPAADVYALGAVLYGCLTGRPPFRGPTTQETLRQVIESEPVPPRLLQPRTPRDLQTVCLKCLEKQPGRRYATALDLAEDLRRFQAGEPVRARPVGRVERAWRRMRRNPAKAMIWGLILLALVLGGACLLSVWKLQTAREILIMEGMKSLKHETQAIGYQLLGEIRAQRSDTWAATQPDNYGHFYARDLFVAAQNGGPREDAVNGLIRMFGKLFRDHPHYLRATFLTRGDKESREVLRLERGANDEVTPVAMDASYPYRSEEEDHLGLSLKPTATQLLLCQVAELQPDGGGAPTPVLHTAAFVRKEGGLTGQPIGLVVVSTDLSSGAAASADNLDFLADETGRIWDGPTAVVGADGSRQWEQVIDVSPDREDHVKPLPTDKWDMQAGWSMGYSYPSVRLLRGPFGRQTFAMHVVKIQYDSLNTDRYLMLARLVSFDRMNR